MKHVTPQNRIGWDGKISSDDKGAPNGVATLDAEGKLLPSQLGVVGWEASSISAGNLIVYKHPDTLFVQNLSTLPTLPEKRLELKASVNGSIRISFKLLSSTQGPVYANAYAQVYINGQPKGTLRSSQSVTPVEYVEEFEFLAGDYLQIYLWIDGATQTPYVNVNVLDVEFSKLGELTLQ